MQNKGRRNGRSIIGIIIAVVVVVIVLSVRFFSNYLNDSAEPTNGINSYVVTPTSARPPLVSDANDELDGIGLDIITTEEADEAQEGPLDTVDIGSGLSTNELLDIIISAINSYTDYEEYYRKIPSAQRGDLALEEFSQYMNLLRKGVGGSVNSYSTMSLEYVRPIVAEMSRHGEEAAAYAEASSFHWLERNTATGETQRFSILIQVDSNQVPYFSRDYILACLDLHAFSRLYYQVVEKGDVDMLSELIYSDIADVEVRREKAQGTIDYYREHVQGDFDSFRLVSVRMDQLTLAQQVTVQADERTESKQTPTTTTATTEPLTPTPAQMQQKQEGASASTPSTQQRYVSIVRQDRSYLIYDAIPEPGLQDARVIQSRNVLLHLDDIYTQRQLEGYLGPIEAVRAWELNRSQEAFDTLVELVWEDKVLTLLTVDYDLESLEGAGQLVNIRTRDPRFTLGDVLEIGMSLEAISETFLYLDVRNYSWIDEDMTVNRLYFNEDDTSIGEIAQASYTYTQIEDALGDRLETNTVEEALEVRLSRQSSMVREQIASYRQALDELGGSKREAVDRYLQQVADEDRSPDHENTDIIESLIPKNAQETDRMH